MCGVNFCYLPYADCNALAADGCESNLSSDPMHCGACATVCPVPANGTARCATNRCGIVCDAGFADCRSGTDGCETSIATDPANCGACRTVCAAAPNAAAACNAGTCAIACNGLFLNCDTDDANGCEIDSGNDPTHCGNCTRRCLVACGTGACIQTTQLGIGTNHGCARMSDGSARCWGLGTSGQLGNGLVASVTTPVTVLRDSPRAPLTNVVEVVAGATHSCALLTDHTVACWGANSVSQLGDGTTTARRAAIIVPAWTGVAEIVAGTSHTCARMMDGTVRCWGTNTSGQIGIGSTAPATTPNLVPALSSVTQIVAGSTHTCALLMDGTVRCWGANGSGQIGDASTTNRTSPTAVSMLSGVRGLTAGATYTCAWLTDGTARCWGRNADGQLGIGSVSTTVTTPTVVTGLAGVTSMAAGTSHTCAVLAAGAVRCWGLDQYGQQCDGAESPDPVTSPTPISSLAATTEIGLGATHSCVRRADGSVHCCGNNEFGQLGSGPIAMGANPSPITVAW
jgi:alpha-tubulin suppressor-like RCC1 family protein